MGSPTKTEHVSFFEHLLWHLHVIWMSSDRIYVQLELQAEVEQLRLDLQNTVAMYKQACEELVHTQNKVRE